MSANSNVLPLPGTELPPAPRKKYVRLSEEAEERLINELNAFDDPGTADYRKLAERYGVSLRTVERLVARTRNKEAPRSRISGSKLQHRLPDDVLVMCAALRSRKKVWNHYRKTGAYCGDYTSFTRRLNADHGANVVSGACRGVKGMKYKLSEKLERRPFMSTYTIDLFSMRAPIRVGRNTVNPYGMLVREDQTGAVVNAYVFDSDAVTADMVGAVVGQAFRGRTYVLTDDEGREKDLFVGGLPDFVYCDNATNFLERELNDMYAGLGVRVIAVNSYASNENGTHERLHGTLRTQLLDLLPQSSRGARDRRGELVDDSAPIDIKQARALLTAWAHQWNREQGLLDEWTKWTEAGAVIRRASDEELAPLALEHPETCKRYTTGVLLDTEHYICSELTRTPSKRFTVRRWLGDENHVEIFSADGKTRIGTAVRNGAHTAAESQALKHTNAQEEQIVNDLQRTAGPLRKQHLDDLATQQPTVRTDNTPTIAPSESAEDTATNEAPAGTRSATAAGQSNSIPDLLMNLSLPSGRHPLTNPPTPDGTETAAGSEKSS